MPADYRIDVARELVLSKATGVLVFAEIKGHQDRLTVDPEFRPHFRQLLDFMEVTDTTLTTNEVRALAEGSPFRAGARRSYAVPAPVYFGLARMFLTLTDDHGVEQHGFYSLEEAREWLGVTADADGVPSPHPEPAR